MTAWPITLADIRDSRKRIRPHLPQTPLRRYAPLDGHVGAGIRVWVKHEGFNPTNSFKARNCLSVVTALDEEERARGVIAATRGNHGQGLAWACGLMGVSVRLCVPLGNNPEKNEAMRGLGALLIEEGRHYDDAVAVARRIAETEGLHIVHSTNDRQVIAGAGTLSLEMLEQCPELGAIVVSVGGGSQAVGALTVARELRPGLEVHAVQAAAAPAIHDSWHAGKRTPRPVGPTLADGLATGDVYPLTFDTLREGLASFSTVTEAEIAESVRVILGTTHQLVEGAGAVTLAGLMKLRPRLAGREVAIVLSGSNIDQPTLQRILDGTI